MNFISNLIANDHYLRRFALMNCYGTANYFFKDLLDIVIVESLTDVSFTCSQIITYLSNIQGISQNQNSYLMDSNDKGSKPLSRPGASAKPKAGTSESSSCSVTDSFMKKISTQPVPSVTPARPGRLRSFRQDKDLSLSPATGKFAIPPSLPANENPNRKKFQPTIPTKKKVQEVKEKKETSEENIPADKGSARGRGRGRGDGAVGRGRGRGRGNANYIQVIWYAHHKLFFFL